MMNTFFPLLLLLLLFLFASLLQCFDFTIAPICQVILFKSFIMKENNDVENFFLICSRVAPLLTLPSKPSIVAIKLNKQFALHLILVQNVKLY